MPYHHGSLRETLLEVSLEQARLGGPDAVGLRAASRAAGVSHNAVYRHFEDRDDLLRAVCDLCVDRLAGLMRQRLAAVPAGDPVDTAWERLRVAGRAYVEFAVAEPGWFRTAFGVAPAPGSEAEDPSAYRVLSETLDGLVESGAMSEANRAGKELPAWAAVHGLATLAVEGPLRDLGDADRHDALELVIAVVVAGLQGA